LIRLPVTDPCWHCRRTGVCDCICCASGYESGPGGFKVKAGPCLVCAVPLLEIQKLEQLRELQEKQRESREKELMLARCGLTD
jgi:hypothetical protein